VLKAAELPRRTVAEILALMPKDSTAVMDADFARDAHMARPLLAAASALLRTTVFDTQLHPRTGAEMGIGPAGVSARATPVDGEPRIERERLFMIPAAALELLSERLSWRPVNPAGHNASRLPSAREPSALPRLLRRYPCQRQVLCKEGFGFQP
jgi:hypothetical protein